MNSCFFLLLFVEFSQLFVFFFFPPDLFVATITNNTFLLDCAQMQVFNCSSGFPSVWQLVSIKLQKVWKLHNWQELVCVLWFAMGFYPSITGREGARDNFHCPFLMYLNRTAGRCKDCPSLSYRSALLSVALENVLLNFS